MVRVFISYSRKDKDKVERLVEQLRAADFEVWWDPHLTPGGRWDKQLLRELEAASSVVIVWSRSSVESHFVMEEALRALNLQKARPVRIEDVPPPFGFATIHAVDLLTNPPHESPRFQDLVQIIRTGGPMTYAEIAERGSARMPPTMLLVPALIVTGLAVAIAGPIFLPANSVMVATTLGSMLSGAALMYALMIMRRSRG